MVCSLADSRIELVIKAETVWEQFERGTEGPRPLSLPPTRRMRGEKRGVVGYRVFDPFFLDGHVRKPPALELRPLPGVRSKIRRRREQLLRNCLAPYVEQLKSGFAPSRWERGTVAEPVSLSGTKRVLPVKARPPIIDQPIGTSPGIAARAPDPSVFGGFGRRRWELRLSSAPLLPWCESVRREGCHAGRSLLIVHRTGRPARCGKLNNVGHACTPMFWREVTKLSTRTAADARSHIIHSVSNSLDSS
jgi:hypothetical protein